MDYSASRVDRVLETNESVTGPIALEMLQRSDLSRFPSSSILTILDNASGAGVVPNLILQLDKKNIIKADQIIITAADKDTMYINQLRARKANASKGSGWENVEIKQFDMQEPPFENDNFDVVFANMGIFFCPDDQKALRETLRIIKPGGQAGFTSWVKIAWWPMAAKALSLKYPSSPALPDASKLFSRGYDDTASFESKLLEAGYKDIQISEYKFKVDIEADRFAEATSTLVNTIIGKYWTKEEVNEYGGKKIETAILEHLLQNYRDGRWDDEMVGIIAFGRK